MPLETTPFIAIPFPFNDETCCNRVDTFPRRTGRSSPAAFESFGEIHRTSISTRLPRRAGIFRCPVETSVNLPRRCSRRCRNLLVVLPEAKEQRTISISVRRFYPMHVVGRRERQLKSAAVKLKCGHTFHAPAAKKRSSQHSARHVRLAAPSALDPPMAFDESRRAYGCRCLDAGLCLGCVRSPAALAACGARPSRLVCLHRRPPARRAPGLHAATRGVPLRALDIWIGQSSPSPSLSLATSANLAFRGVGRSYRCHRPLLALHAVGRAGTQLRSGRRCAGLFHFCA